MVRSEHEMHPAEIRELLDELSRRLDAAGVSARIHVIGGSAMALSFPTDTETRMTRDIDAVIQPTEEVRRVVAQMAEDLGLPPTWLNDGGSAWSRREVSPRRHGVEVSVASSDELIAMKLASAREQDLYDLGILARHAGITDAQDLVDIAFRLYGDDSVELPYTREDYRIMAEQALARAGKRAKRTT